MVYAAAVMAIFMLFESMTVRSPGNIRHGQASVGPHLLFARLRQRLDTCSLPLTTYTLTLSAATTAL